MTKLYARLASENEREALETLAEELGDVLGTSDGPSRNGTDPEPSGALRDRLSALLEAGEDREDPAERLRAWAGELVERA